MDSGLVRRFGQLWGLPFTRVQMLWVSMALIAGTSLFFGLVLDLPYDATLNIRLGIFLILCMPLLYWPASYVWVANLLLGASLVTIFWIAAQTGGINSMALMWPAALSVLALLLMGLKGTLFWWGATVLSFLCLHQLTVNGVMGGSNAHVLDKSAWGLFTVLVLTVLLMVGVHMYDYLHGLHMRKLQASNKELQRTHEALIRLQNLRDEFVAAVGHELRTPMNAILGFNGLLRDQIGPDSRMISTVDHIHDATHQLLGLVNDILDFSQLQAGKMQLHPRPCDLNALMAEASVPWRAAARAKGVELVMQAPSDFPQDILLDERKFKKMVDNLVGNAIKFTSAGLVVVKWGQHAQSFQLQVSDTGQGIAPEVQSQIFKRFERADLETNRKYGGTGLGLAICDGLVKIHGGRIGVSSQEGLGSTFWIQLPLQRAGSADAPAHLAADIQVLPADAEFKVLLVDDNQLNVMVAEIQLAKAWPRLSVVSCLSGAGALAAIAKQHFDLALVDMVMPEIDGIELTRRLRAHEDPQTSKMPIVAFTANVEPHERQRCLEAGMDDVLTKPMDEKLMVARISNLLRQRYPGRWS